MPRKSSGKRKGATAPSTTKRAGTAPSTAATAASTEGQRLLLEVPASLATIATKLGCSKALVGFWRQGKKDPSAELRAGLEKAYGIPVASWDVPPGAAVEGEEPEADAARDGSPIEGRDSLDLVNDRMRLIEARLKRDNLTEAVRAKLEETFKGLLSMRMRHEEKLAQRRVMDLDAFVRGPEWARMKAAILDALRPFPDAAASAGEVLKELDR